ncbi:MAG: hypothetical protein IJ775_07070 [Muribaculaceae bacterium]|nr:hypothetical protein [Muribaculaceae bacterium]
MEQEEKIITPRDYTLQELRREVRQRTRRSLLLGLLIGIAVGALLMWLVCLP